MTTASAVVAPGVEAGPVAISGEPRAVRGLLVGHRATAAQEVEVDALVGLQHVIEEHPQVAAGDPVPPRPPRRPPRRREARDGGTPEGRRWWPRTAAAATPPAAARSPRRPLAG